MEGLVPWRSRFVNGLGRSQVSGPIRFAAEDVLTFRSSGASGKFTGARGEITNMDLSKTGAAGRAGRTGILHAPAGGAGGRGGLAAVANTQSSDPTNSAEAWGGLGGGGGSGYIVDESFVGAGGNGATGGAASAVAASLVADSSGTSATAQSIAGSGGGGGYGGQVGAPFTIGAGGAGGAATRTSARDVNTLGAASATAFAEGGDAGQGGSGANGGAVTGTTAYASGLTASAVSKAFAGAGSWLVSNDGSNAGDGGVASGTSAVAIGVSEADASVVQAGGGGGSTDAVASGGVGADSILSAGSAKGRTQGGTLSLSEQAEGGAAGELQGEPGAGGDGGLASATMVVDDAANPLKWRSQTITASAQADGGAGGGAGIPSTGGNATASTTVTGDSSATVTANATAKGGYGGIGGLGGSATANALASGGVANANATADDGGANATPIVTAAAFGVSAANAQATGLGGGAEALDDVVTGDTDDGALGLSQTAIGGAGGASSTLTYDYAKYAPNASITGLSSAQSEADSVAELDLTGAPTITGTASASGGSTALAEANVAASQVQVLSTASGALSATSIATGTATNSQVTSNAYAVGDYTEDAYGNFFVNELGQASATATAVGATGVVDTLAQSGLMSGAQKGTLSVSQVQAIGAGEVDGTAVGTAQAGYAAALPTFCTSGVSVSYATAAPAAAVSAAVLAANPNMASALGGATTVFALGELGGGHASSGLDAETSTSSAILTLNLLSLTGQGELALGLYQGEAVGAGVTGVTLVVSSGKQTWVDQSFGSVADAQAYFTDPAPLDLRAVGPKLPLQPVTVSLTVTTDAAGSGFYGDFLLAFVPDQTASASPAGFAQAMAAVAPSAAAATNGASHAVQQSRLSLAAPRASSVA
jgi:hypothetical protein